MLGELVFDCYPRLLAQRALQARNCPLIAKLRMHRLRESQRFLKVFVSFVWPLQFEEKEAQPGLCLN